MHILFEELSAPQRAGGIESATVGLLRCLESRGLKVCRSSESNDPEDQVAPDVVHFHGIWSPYLARRWRYWNARAVPCMISIHGMLEPWALAHKALKKKIAWHVYQKRILNGSAALHATSAREAENLRKLGLTSQIVMIPWGIEVPAEAPEESEGLNVESRKSGDEDEDEDEKDAAFALASSDLATSSSSTALLTDLKTLSPSDISTSPATSSLPRIALFVGRIYPVKGLPLLIEAWAKVRPAGWKMRVVGPDEAGHLAEVKSLVARAGLEAVFEFPGPAEGGALQREYRNADLFILPSHTENFGMVVGEAMSHGLPVITTHGAPWKLLEEEQCGWWVPVSVAGIADALEDATSRSADELQAMGARGRQIVEERFAWDRIAQEMVACYGWVLGMEAKPECVSE